MMSITTTQRKRKKEGSGTGTVTTIPSATVRPTVLRVAGYCRTSTDMESQKTSIDGQRLHYRNYIESHFGWRLVDIYWESGVSGTKTETRPELQRLLADCRAGLIDMVVTKSISRFSRNAADCLELVRSLSDLGITLRFEKENIQTDRMESELMLSILAAVSQDESRSLSANMKWGIRKRFAAGTYRAPRAPYGYRKLPKPESRGQHEPKSPIYIVDPAEADVIRRIFYACVNGKRAGVIAKELNEAGIPTWGRQNAVKGSRINGNSIWKEQTILAILQNIFYTGDILYQKTFVDDAYKQVKNNGQIDQYLNEGSHEAIIDKDTFRMAQVMIRRRAGKS